MKFKFQQSTIEAFIKSGVCCMQPAFSAFASYHYLNRTYVKSVSQAVARKIPIYCVDTEEKKVALSFDAAWG